MPDRNARVWTGSAWESISAPVSVSNAVAGYQSSAPSSPVTGQIWIDSDDNTIYVWNGSSWVNTQSLPSQVAQSGRYLTTNGTTASWGVIDFTAYASTISPTFTGSVTLPSTTSIGDVSSTEISYLDGVTSSIQTQLDNKEKSIPLQNIAPSSPSASDLWVDNTDPAKPVLKVYDGSSWITAGSSVTADDDQIILASRIFT